jgi:hypothetical protein
MQIRALEPTIPRFGRAEVKDAYEVLEQKEAELACVREEVESLRLVATLPWDEVTSDEPTKELPLEANRF